MARICPAPRKKSPRLAAPLHLPWSAYFKGHAKTTCPQRLRRGPARSARRPLVFDENLTKERIRAEYVSRKLKAKTAADHLGESARKYHTRDLPAMFEIGTHLLFIRHFKRYQVDGYGRVGPEKQGQDQAAA